MSKISEKTVKTIALVIVGLLSFFTLIGGCTYGIPGIIVLLITAAASVGLILYISDILKRYELQMAAPNTATAEEEVKKTRIPAVVLLLLSWGGAIYSLYVIFVYNIFSSTPGKKTIASNENAAPKSKGVAIALSILTGTVGGHRYYLGYQTSAIIQTVLGVLGISGWLAPYMVERPTDFLVNVFMPLALIALVVCGIWCFVDIIRILIDKLMPVNGLGWSSTQQNAAPQPVPETVVRSSNVEALEKLATLHQQGILTDEEFAQKKAELLSKI